MCSEKPEVTAAPSGPGRLARRIIKDWLLGLLEDNPIQWQQEPNPSDWACPRLRTVSQKQNASPEHDIIIIPSQGHEKPGDVLVSSMCRFCRYHFVFRITSTEPCCGSWECPTLIHHHLLTSKPEKYSPDDIYTNLETKFYPLRCRVVYNCSACPLVVELEVTAPRLLPDAILLITDEKRIEKALAAAKEEEPERYADTNEAQATRYVKGPLVTLNAYLKNIIELQVFSGKKISARNKTFLVQFGRSCEHIFRYLGFTFEPDENDTEEHVEGFWAPPVLKLEDSKTPLRTERAFLEDVRSEVQALLEELSPEPIEVVKLVSARARDALEKALHARNRIVQRSINKSLAPHFRILGAPTDSDDEMLRWAYRRQAESDSDGSHKRVYLEALGKLATEIQSEQLQMFCVQETVTLDALEASTAQPKDPLDEAYAHLNLLDKREYYTASNILYSYGNLREQAPRQQSKHRNALHIIGTHLRSDDIKAEAENLTLEEACNYLQVEDNWPLDSIAAFVPSQNENELVPQIAIAALRKIAESRVNEEGHGAIANAIAQMEARIAVTTPELVPRTGDMTVQGGASDNSLPVGLENLRNTCYLNSILQYFYSVNAVRDTVLSAQQPLLASEEQGVREILQGTSSSDLEPGRAYVGSEFCRELQTLFQSLQNTQSRSLTPRQRLANAALLQPEKARPKSDDSAPVAGPANKDAPPLPPRVAENDEPGMQIDAASGNSETSSTTSGQTLVEKPDDDPSSYVVVGHDADGKGEVTAMELDSAGPPESLTKDAQPKGSKLTVEDLAVELDKPNVGSDQMDVDEIMGNTIDHLRAAYKVAHLADTSPDPIEQAFFTTFIDNRKKVGEDKWKLVSRSDRWATAYPAKTGCRNLYDALAVPLDLERLPGDLLSFTTIDKPAPNFHIFIQRSDGVRKNSNPVEIPETLYLDRFMHTTDNSDGFQARRREWDLKNRLSEIEATETEGVTTGDPKPNPFLKDPAPEMPENGVDMDEVDGFLMLPRPAFTNISDDDWNTVDATLRKAHAEHPDIKIDLPTPPQRPKPTDLEQTLSASLEEFWTEFHAAELDEKARLKAEKDDLFKDKTSVVYRLHAVVCHAGATASAGHYWVWIHDFEQDVWRKYNDSTVSIHPAEFVFRELNTKGEPYYLAYVRATEIDKLVSIPRRSPPDVEMTGTVAEPETTLMAEFQSRIAGP